MLRNITIKNWYITNYCHCWIFILVGFYDFMVLFLLFFIFVGFLLVFCWFFVFFSNIAAYK
jgi:hypothetical protein